MTRAPFVAVFPLPFEVAAAAGMEPRLVRLFPGDLDGPASEAARGLDPRALLLAGAAAASGARPVWTGGASDLKEIHGALLARLGPGGARAFPWPLRPAREELAGELQGFACDLGLPGLEAAEEVYARDERARGPLRDWERECGEGPRPPCPAPLYRDTLAAVARQGVLAAPPRLPRVRAPRHAASSVRLGLLGGTELMVDLPERIEALGARVAVDEWTWACAHLAPSSDLAGRYLGLALPYGLEARARAMRALEEPRRLDGWVLVTSPFGASNLERVGFPRWLGRPVLALEADARRPLSGADLLRLEAFHRGLQEARA